jgi:MFS family permease
MLKHQNKYFPFLMWGFPLLFFTYQFILRLWPSLMMHSIMENLLIDASGFGFLAAVYYYGYSSMQIPVAILLDRFGARYTIFGCAILCGCASLLFTYTDNFYLACLSRFFVGVGSAVGFLGTSKVISEWFSKDHYARMIGLSFTFGLMGALYGGKPINLLIENHGGAVVAVVLACVSIGLGIVTYACLKSPGTESSSCKPESFKLAHFKTLFSSPFIWFLAIANLLMVGSLEGFADVWGVPYLMIAYGLAKGDAAELISFIFVGMLFGGPLLAFLSKRMGTYRVIVFCGVGMAFSFLLLLSGFFYSWYCLAALLFCIGILCCYQVIVFVVGSELVSPVLLSVTVAFINSINMLGGSFFHTTIGLIMDASWTGLLDAEGIRHYTIKSYEVSLLVIPLCAFIGACIVGGLGFKWHQKKPSILRGPV